jgi:hypothetical protein
VSGGKGFAHLIVDTVYVDVCIVMHTFAFRFDIQSSMGRMTISGRQFLFIPLISVALDRQVLYSVTVRTIHLRLLVSSILKDQVRDYCAACEKFSRRDLAFSFGHGFREQAQQFKRNVRGG